MKSENLHALTLELTELTPEQRSILSDRLREIGHVSSVSRTLIEERLSNQRRFDANGYFTRSFGRLGVPTVKYLQQSWRLDFMNRSKRVINCAT